jgi:hypothetical protein
MNRLECVINRFYHNRRSNDVALRRIDRLGRDFHELPLVIVPLFSAKKTYRA